VSLFVISPEEVEFYSQADHKKKIEYELIFFSCSYINITIFKLVLEVFIILVKSTTLRNFYLCSQEQLYTFRPRLVELDLH
jgi:hypothetical protein